ncbi:hypothetical protein CC2G_012670 [Coprinopsis cinerea AmutBmut pab1-1]|nr:hypothetical protein CC2G_012670 [Coprinopsis cinerea AmutBmut pab1-1]
MHLAGWHPSLPKSSTMSEFRPSLMHFFNSFKESLFLGNPRWTPAEIPCLKDKVIIVTGGNSGIGYDTVKALLEHEATVYIVSRNESKALPVIDELEKETGKRALYIQAELSDLSSVKRAAEQFLSKEDRLDILYNNAGIVYPFATTPEGNDLIFETNVTGTVRIINVSSSAHRLVPATNPLKLDAIQEGPLRDQVLRMYGYGFSKFCSNLYTNELARRYKDTNIVVMSVHPGCFHTSMTDHMPQTLANRMINKIIFIYSPDYKAYTQLWAGTAPEAGKLHGKYITPWNSVGNPRAETQDEGLMTELWTYLEGRVKAHELKQVEGA